MTDSTQTTRFRLGRWLIRFIGVTVPRRFRDRFRQEWEAELEYREALLARWDRLDWRNKLELLWRSLGAFWDALWLQRQRLEEDMIQDLLFGLRMLLKNPGFTAVAVLTLALGIGANTAIFSVINAVLLRHLPYAQPEQIVALWDDRGAPSPTQGTTAPRNFQWWREHSRSFSDLALTQGIGYRITDTQEAASGAGLEVTPNLFALLGVSALRGRTLAPGDETAGVKPVVLSHRLWQSSFGADENVVGRNSKLGDTAYTVVGIMPPQFVFSPSISLAADGVDRDCDLWVPMAIDQRRLQQTGKNYFAYGRLRAGVTLAQAQSEMNAFAPRLQET